MSRHEPAKLYSTCTTLNKEQSREFASGRNKRKTCRSCQRRGGGWMGQVAKAALPDVEKLLTLWFNEVRPENLP